MRLPTVRMLREQFALNLVLLVLLGLLFSCVGSSPISVYDNVGVEAFPLGTLDSRDGNQQNYEHKVEAYAGVVGTGSLLALVELHAKNNSKVVLAPPDPTDPKPESEEFTKRKCKGQAYLHDIAEGKNTASKFQSYYQLEDAHWNVFAQQGPDIEMDNELHMKELGIDPEEESWYRWGVLRSNEFGGGRFFEKFNPEHGIFVAVNNRSPSGGKEDALTKFSDVGWLGWKAACENEEIEPGTMRYMFQHTVINDISRAIVAEVFARHDQKHIDWPGLDFGMDTEDGQAMLGSPNGLGLGWMIKDHQHYFRRKTVGSVKVWYGLKGQGPYPNMLFSLVEMPALEPEQPAPPQFFRARL